MTVLTRPSSVDNDEVKALKDRGLRIVALDLATGTKAEFLQALEGLDVLVSAVSYKALTDQLRLLEAVKEAGIKRFVPCFWGTPAPRGEQHLLDLVCLLCLLARLPFTSPQMINLFLWKCIVNIIVSIWG